VAVETLDRVAKEKRLPIKPRIFDVKCPLPFQDGYFDAAYSHMLFNIRFSHNFENGDANRLKTRMIMIEKTG
jgi:hypothetical protein